ncbi:uncharacterized protein PGTG_17865 [Puccinia graminis f. sp. tritici CRL 75-36-700-3]|uniref:Uncharacterized protein n=1 Tax=Puccinia graminis f. sp. tritici (strain CRL 75-36-700-3 / race SCCL) TaxID=418459 RepID=E3L659_PUCGT|nr:uncharacterized protein PGTG_17865 [Puccinia graminis f. sp. tritici CRL 75-36-700-3]EFP92034.1 hypothetical protein PGTG_17865 [Puccinia graminis f. sp. tritici CRL 75-36-700-3]
MSEPRTTGNELILPTGATNARESNVDAGVNPHPRPLFNPPSTASTPLGTNPPSPWIITPPELLFTSSPHLETPDFDSEMRIKINSARSSDLKQSQKTTSATAKDQTNDNTIEKRKVFEDKEVAKEEVNLINQSDHETEEDIQSKDGHPEANNADSDDTDAMLDPQGNAKEWFLPNLEDTFGTYINHGCILDKQGYPIYPNGKTVFVRKPGKTVTNFGTVGFSKTSSSNKRGINNDWKVVRYFCLGALKLEEGKTKCPGKSGKCNGNVTHKKCCQNSVAVRFDYHLPTGWGLLRHKGKHPHPWPEAEKPDPMSKDERGLLITSASFFPQNEHFTFQTQWMADRLLARDENNQVYSGGLISNVTYRYFETGYLLSTSMYCEDLHRWIPIQLTWIRGLSEEYYKLHFTTLFRQFQAAPVTPAERDTLVRQVVDFSTAQAEGFVSAYLEVFRQGTQKEVRRMLKGCREHFRQSVTRIKRNRALMTADEEEPFQKACMDLLEHQEAGGKTHEEKVDFLRRCYPKFRNWLDWWTVSDIEALLFPSRQPRLEDTPDGLSNTTNAQESMHRIYYRLSDGNQYTMVGMVDLFSFVKMLEEDWKAAMKGIPISYGANPTTDIGTTLGIAKKRKCGKGKFINDGRPPDTTDELVDGKKKKKAKLGRPPNLTNFNKSLCPLWLCGISGHGKDVFTAIAHHFSCQSTGELNGSNTIRSTLTRGQNMVFNVLSPKCPGRFLPGAFASCDYFLEVALDPQLHKKDEYKQLFSIDEHQTFTCELQLNKLQKHPTRDHRTLHVLTIKPQMFDENRIPHSDVSKLIEMWQTNGLLATSGMICKHCNPNKPKPKLPKNTKIQKVSSDVDNINVGGATYTLISRGYWQQNHYWCKVLRSANISADKGSLTAIWLHNDAENDGYAEQINQVPSLIAGVEEKHKLLLYCAIEHLRRKNMSTNAIQKIAREKSPSTTTGNAPKNYTSPLKGTTPIAQLASQMNAQIAQKYAIDQKEPDTKQQCSLDAEVTLEIDKSFLSVGNKSHGDQSFVLGDQSCGKSRDQSFVLGDQSLESHGDQSCGKDGNKDGGDQTFSLGDHTGEDGGDQSFALGEQSLGNQTGNQSLADETDDHVTQTQVKHSQEDEEVPQKPPIRFKVILRPLEKGSPPSTKGKTQASRQSVRKKK